MKAFTQLTRFFFVGVVNNLALFCAYLLLTAAGVKALLAMTAVFVSGIFLSWFFNARFTFKQRLNRASAGRNSVAYAAAYLLNVGLLWCAYSLWGIPHQIAQGLIMVLLAAMLFLAQKYWVFAQHPKRPMA